MQPLQAYIREKELIIERNIDNYDKLLRQQNAIIGSFGRRNQDLIRELGINSVERAIINGSVSQGRKQLYEELLTNVPIIDGKFHLETAPYNGKFIKFNAKYYADLVSRTTRQEAINVTNAEIRSKELETNFVRFNRTGKNYLALNDACHAIDGKVFSNESGGSYLNGVFYPYWRDALKGIFSIPHPNCRHHLRPISVATVPDYEPGITYANYQNIQTQYNSSRNRRVA